MLLLPTLLLYALGLLLTGIGSRLASRCATWCGALCGLPMWMVGGTLVAVCTALPQLVLAFLAAGMSVTALAVGTALAGAVTQLGLVLALCLLRCNVTVVRPDGSSGGIFSPSSFWTVISSSPSRNAKRYW